LLDNTPAPVRAALLDYLATVVDLPRLKSLVDSGIPEMALAEASTAARLRAGDADAMSGLELAPALSGRLRNAVREFSSNATDDTLRAGLASRHEIVRQFAAEALARREAMTDDLAFTLIKDSSPQIRAMGYRVLLATGAEIDLDQMNEALKDLTFSEKEALRVAYYRRMPIARLNNMASMFEIEGPEAYEAAGLQYPQEFIERVRRDLGDDLSSFYDESLASLHSQYSEDDAKNIEKLWLDKPSLMSFMRSAYVAAGLRILATHGESSDAAHGRFWIANDDDAIRAAAAHVLARFGEPEDAAALVAVAATAYGATAAFAATAAVALSSDTEQVLRPLLQTGKTEAMHAAAERIISGTPDDALPMLISLLRDERSTTRVLAAASIVRLSREHALETLDEYQRGYRYYDVVTCFDRLLFAPEPLRAAFLGEATGTVAWD
jgi:hypothetical protein